MVNRLAGKNFGGSLSLALIQVLLHARRESVDSMTHDASSNAVIEAFGHNVPIQLPKCCTGIGLPGTCQAPCRLFGLVPSTTGYPNEDRGTKQSLHHIISGLRTRRGRRSWLIQRSCAIHFSAWPVAGIGKTVGPSGFLPEKKSFWTGARVVAQHASRQGLHVKFVVYESMPQVFPVMRPDLDESKHCVRLWAQICLEMISRCEGASRSY